MCGDARERIPLEPEALLEQPRADLARRAATPAGGEAGLRLLRQVEPVGRETHSVLPLGRVLEARQHFAYPHERLLPVRGALDLEAHAIGEIALRPAEQLVELAGKVG